MTVVQEELPLIKQAFRKFDTPQKMYQPALTIVICVSLFRLVHDPIYLIVYRVNAIILDSSQRQKPMLTALATLVRERSSIAVSPLSTISIFSCKVGDQPPISVSSYFMTTCFNSSRWPPRHDPSHPLLCCTRRDRLQS